MSFNDVQISKTIEKLRLWAGKYHITDPQLNELLEILREPLPELYTCANALLTTSPVKFEFLEMPETDEDMALATEENLQEKHPNALSQILSNQARMIQMLESSQIFQNAARVACPPFVEAHNIQLPLNSIEEFVDFDKRLAEDNQFRNDFIDSMHLYWNPRVTALTRHITAVLQKIIRREVANRFTSTKKIGNKMIMKSTSFNQCLITFLQLKGSWTVDEIQKALGIVLTNSKDWDGHRKNRECKTCVKKNDYSDVE